MTHLFTPVFFSYCRAIALLPGIGRAQAPAFSQAVSLNTSGGGISVSQGVAVDAAGNQYVTGSFSGTITLGTTTLVSAGGADVFVAKFAANGAALWAVRAGGTDTDECRGVAVDAAGNALVTGYFQSTATFATSPAPTSLTSAGSRDVFVAKFAAVNGAAQWAVRAGGSITDEGYGVAVDAAGNALVTGYFQSTATFATGSAPTSLTSAGYDDVFVAKFAAADGATQWAVRAGGSNNDNVYGVAVDAAGNALVTGAFFYTATFVGSMAPTSLTSAGSNDVFVAKFAAADGAAQWAVRAGGTGYDYGSGVAVDAAGNALVTGYFSGTATFATGPAPTSLTAAGGGDVFVAKFAAANGSAQWAARAGGSNDDYGYGVAVDAAGNALVTGSFYNTATFTTSPAPTSLTSAGGGDVFVAKFAAADGATQWAVQAGGGGPDTGTGMAVDAAGNTFVTGNFAGTANFGSLTVAGSGSGFTGFLAKLGAAPLPLPVAAVRVAAGGLALFPNPASAGTTLRGVAAGAPVQVFDAVGRLVLTATADATGTAQLTLPAGQPTGLYVVRAGQQTARLVLE